MGDPGAVVRLVVIGAFHASAVAYLLHPEHGATGCPPGKYVIRRQREYAERRGTYLVAD